MLQNVMSAELFDEFVMERMEIAENNSELTKTIKNHMNYLTGKVYEIADIFGKQYYAAGLRNGQLLQKSGGLPRTENSPRPTPQS